jgi:predicted dinucleotide-binding enzyme
MNTQQERHVIFGTGPVGRAIADELSAQGKTIRMVNRSG